jgi:hypothetical protein
MTKQSTAQRAHDQMHRLPGVPEHSEAENLNQRAGLPNRPLKNRPLQDQHAGSNQSHSEPKVLVGWQNAIARFFSKGKK